MPFLLENVDPTYFIFRNVKILSAPWILVFRIISIFSPLLHSSVILVSGVIILTNVLIITISAITSMINDKKTKKLGRIKVFQKIQNMVQFLQYISKYRQIQLVICVMNDVCYFVFPLVLLLPLIAVVGTGYILVKLTRFIPFPIIFVSAVFGVCCIAGLHMIMPLLAEITTRSQEFVRHWELRGVTDYRVKSLKSCGPIRVAMGPFFYVNKWTRSTFLSLMVYYTVSVIILV